MEYIPDRGDLIWLNFDPQAGREQAGHRPALVLSPKEYNKKTNLAVMCPITNQAKGYPFEVLLPAGSAVQGAVLTDHLKNLDWKVRKASYRGKASNVVIDNVINKISTLLMID